MKNRAAIALILFFALFYMAFLPGCKKKEQPIPTPTPTHTPVPKLEKIIFTFNGDLFWINTDGTGREELFPDNNSKWFPSVSPDGFYVAYWVQTANSYNMWVGDFKKNRAYQITFDEDPLEGDVQNFSINNAPSWTTDSEALYYSRNKDIWKITRDGYNQVAITDTHNCISPSLSKTGILVYARIEDRGAMNLYRKNAEAMQDEKMTNYLERKAGSPSFSPDGRNIVYTIVDGESVNIFTADAMNRDMQGRQITFDGSSYAPSYSHDGRLIVFSSFVNDKYQPQIWVMNTDGSDRKKLTEKGGVSPSWLYRLLDAPMPTFTPTPDVAVQPAADTEEEPAVEPAQEQREIPAEPELTPPPAEDLAVRVEKDGDRLVFMPVIHFDSASDRIKAEFYRVLDDMVKIAVNYESPIIVEGHTDNMPIETAEYPDNRALSLARAKSVKKYLVEKHGIKPSRIAVNGYGEDRPVAPNTTEENMYRNRRAEFYIKLNQAELNKPVFTGESMPEPAVKPTEPPTPVPTPTPKLNFIQKMFKKKPAVKKVPSGQKTGGW